MCASVLNASVPSVLVFHSAGRREEAPMVELRCRSDEKRDEEQRAPDGVRYKLCALCGQTYDNKDLAQVYHHDNRPHVWMRAR